MLAPPLPVSLDGDFQVTGYSSASFSFHPSSSDAHGASQWPPPVQDCQRYFYRYPGTKRPSRWLVTTIRTSSQLTLNPAIKHSQTFQRNTLNKMKKKRKEKNRKDRTLYREIIRPCNVFFLFFHLFFLSNLSKARKKQPPGKNINYDWRGTGENTAEKSDRRAMRSVSGENGDTLFRLLRRVWNPFAFVPYW